MPGRKLSAKKVSSSEQEELHCTCRQPEDGKFMIACDDCDIWFHGDCVKVKKEYGEKLTGEWYCPKCFVKRAQAQKTRRVDTSSHSSPKTPRRMPAVARTPTSATVPKSGAEPTVRNTSLRASEKHGCMVCKTNPARQGSRVCSDACLLKVAEPAADRQAEIGTQTQTQTKMSRRIKIEQPEITSFESQFACGGCKKWPMLTPIYQCNAGHSLCNPCSLKLTTCSTCGARLPDQKIRAPAVEAIQPPLTKCSQPPCHVIFANVTDRNKHLESECHFSRKLPICQYLGIGMCEVACSLVDEALDHLTSIHGAEVQVVEAGSLMEQIHHFKPWTPEEPMLTCVKYTNALVVVQQTKKQTRRQLRVFAFGNHLELQKLSLFVETKIVPASEQLFAEIIVNNIHRSRTTTKLMPFTCKSIDAYKALYTFDIGLESMGCCLVWRITSVD